MSGLAVGFYFNAGPSEGPRLADIAEPSAAPDEEPYPPFSENASSGTSHSQDNGRGSQSDSASQGTAVDGPASVATNTPDASGGEAPPVAAFKRAPRQDMAETAAPPVKAAWRRHASGTTRGPAGEAPEIAIVIDDLGLNRANARQVLDLPAPLTLAFMTYAPKVASLTKQARANGHELMVHVPMQPADPDTNPGPRVLRGGLAKAELLARLRWGLSRFDGYVGINNHMGSAFTTNRDGMGIVIDELRQRGLLFLDSVTSGGTVGADVAAETGVPYARRDIFLDNERDATAIRRQLAKVERVARERGHAIAIGHPHDETIAVLRDWLRKAPERGLRLVPISALVRTGERGPDIARLNR